MRKVDRHRLEVAVTTGMLLVVVISFLSIFYEDSVTNDGAINALSPAPIVVSGNPTSFLSRWDTSKTSSGSSSSNMIKLPLESNGTYNFAVTWGDGNSDTITNWNQAQVWHTYATAGIFNINITGTCWGWRFNNGGDRYKLIEISQWGLLRLGNSGNYFQGCYYLNLTAIDAPDLTDTTNLKYTFWDCRNLGSAGNMSEWDTSNVTTMQEMFMYTTAFNQDISTWNVSKVTNMIFMLGYARSFNQDIGSWNVSSVTTMGSMFAGASSFNQDISTWDTSGVIFMEDMFYGATLFNQNISSWDVSRVTNMRRFFSDTSSFNQPIGSWNVSSVDFMYSMFDHATSFNQPIGGWNVSRVTNMDYMFRGATSFNQNLSSWNVSRVRSMGLMFYDATSFNQDIGGWNVSRVTNMDRMFDGATSFNQPIGGWSVSSVTFMRGMFAGVSLFNQDIGGWNVSRVTTMERMFDAAWSFDQPIGGWNVSRVVIMDYMFGGARSFNQNISSWNVSRVTTMKSMFGGARSFNQNISSWNVSRVTTMSGMFSGVTLSTANYDSLLIAWSQLPLQTGVNFDAGYSKYSSAASPAKAAIISTFGWNIYDGGLEYNRNDPDGSIDPIIPIVVLLIVGIVVVIALIASSPRSKLPKYKSPSKVNEVVYRRPEHNSLAQKPTIQPSSLPGPTVVVCRVCRQPVPKGMEKGKFCVYCGKANGVNVLK